MKRSGRYATSHLTEDQYESGSRQRVLKNLLGITSAREMDRTEAIALKQAEDALLRMEVYGEQHQFSAKDICAIHEIWLGNIYPWAGRYRQVKLVKEGFPFAFPERIPELMTAFEQEVLHRHTPCLSDSQDRVADALAETHTELMLIHPFREGNGRVGRILATLMALQAGLPPLLFAPIEGRGTAPYIRAIHVGMDKDYRPMRAIFQRIVQESLAKARKTDFSGA